MPLKNHLMQCFQIWGRIAAPLLPPENLFPHILKFSALIFNFSGISYRLLIYRSAPFGPKLGEGLKRPHLDVKIVDESLEMKEG